MKVNQMLKDGKLPLSKPMLVEEFKSLGLENGDKVLVHSSLSSFGYVIDGARAVIDALIEVVGDKGLIMMPGHSSWNSHPSTWSNPPMPKEWEKHIADNILPYDPDRSAIDFVGVIPNAFSKYKSVIRTNHPSVSFLMYGDYDGWIEQPLNNPLGIHSQLMKLYKEGGKSLFLGVDYSNATALHLSEYLSDNISFEVNKSKVLVDGKALWMDITEKEAQCEFYNIIGALYEKEHEYHERVIGYSLSKLVDIKKLVDTGKSFMDRNSLKAETVKVEESYVIDQYLDSKKYSITAKHPNDYVAVYGFQLDGKYYVLDGLEYLYYHAKKGVKKYDLLCLDLDEKYHQVIKERIVDLRQKGITSVMDITEQTDYEKFDTKSWDTMIVNIREEIMKGVQKMINNLR
jgi:aminoglycoside 3-N-acetyltransferase